MSNNAADRANETRTAGTGNKGGEQRQKARIIPDPIPFPSTNNTAMMTIVDLGNEINKLFKPIFRDYYGCNIVMTNPVMYGGLNDGRFQVELHFKEGANASTADAIPNLQNIMKSVQTTPGAHRSIGERMQLVNARAMPNKNYILTDYTKDIIENYIMPWHKDRNKKDGKLKWENFSWEITEPGYAPTSYSIYLKVVGLDLIAILRDIWGEKNDKGNYVDYQVEYIRPLPAMYGQGTFFQPQSPTFMNNLVNISQLDTSEVQKLANKVGMAGALNQIPVIRVQ